MLAVASTSNLSDTCTYMRGLLLELNRIAFSFTVGVSLFFCNPGFWVEPCQSGHFCPVLCIKPLPELSADPCSGDLVWRSALSSSIRRSWHTGNMRITSTGSIYLSLWIWLCPGVLNSEEVGLENVGARMALSWVEFGRW